MISPVTSSKFIVFLLNFKKVKLIVLLQPTSPLRTGKDIDSAIELFYKKKPDTLVSVTTKKNVRKKSKIMIEKNGYLSFFNNKIDFYNKNKDYLTYVQRVDILNRIWVYTASIYIFSSFQNGFV